MANEFITPKAIADEALMHLENELVIANKVHVDYSKEFTAVGDEVTVRKPLRFQGQKDNLDVTGYREDLTEGSIKVKMDKTISIPFEIDPLDMTLRVEDSKFQERYIAPAVIKLKDEIETELGNLYSDVYHFTGTPGTLPSTFKDVGRARVIMTNAAVPKSNRTAIHNPDTILELSDKITTLTPEGKAKTALEDVFIGRFGGFDNYESVHIPTHTVGALGGTPLVNGASQNVTYSSVKDAEGQTLDTDGWSNSVTGVLKKGDVFTIAGVYAVNPVSKQSTGALQNFVVTADVDSNGSGEATLSISPYIITSGAYQTVTAAPADNAAITVKTGSAGQENVQSLMFTKNAFALVTRPLKIPKKGLDTYTAMGNRMSISVTQDGDFNTLSHSYRLDILFGRKTIDANQAARLTG